MTSISIIIFAFNEAENIPIVLGDLRAYLTQFEPNSEIVFVDDGSTDGTLDAAKKALEGFPHKTARHEKNGGIGAALKSGVRIATSTWCTFLPADGQIRPDAIGVLRDAQRRENADVVFSVYDHRDDGLDRKILSWGVRALIRAVHGVTMQSDGPYLFRRASFNPDDLPPNTFFLNFEFPIRVLAGSLRKTVVTIACEPRLSGQSKSTGWKRIQGVARDLIDLRIRRFRGQAKPITER